MTDRQQPPDSLTDQQMAAIPHTGSRLLIIAGPGSGETEVRAGYANWFAGLPDAHYGEDRHWVCDNMGFSEWTLTGIIPSGEHPEVRGTDHLEFREGKIVRENSFWKIVKK